MTNAIDNASIQIYYFNKIKLILNNIKIYYNIIMSKEKIQVLKTF